MNPQFLRELEDSLYLHRPLPLHREQSLEASFPAKRVLDRQSIWTRDCQSIGPLCRRDGHTAAAEYHTDHDNLPACLRLARRNRIRRRL